MKILNLLDSLTKVEETNPLTLPSSRREAFGRMGDIAIDLAKVAVPFGIAAAIPTRGMAQTGASAVDVLNFALTLEYLEAEFYETGLSTKDLLTGATRSTIEQIAKHERSHVNFLTSAIRAANGNPVGKPTFDFTAKGTFPTVFTDKDTFLAVAQAFEDTGVRAYKGQAGNLSGDTLTAALQIHSVEARHAAMIRRMRGLTGWIPFADGIPGVDAAKAVYAGEENVTQLTLDATKNSGGVDAQRVTEAYDEPLTKDAVLKIAGMFIIA